MDYLLGPLKRYLSDILRARLSEWLELDDIGVLGADLVVNNVRLRLSKLASVLPVDFPLEITRGFIHELRIAIPWTSLLSTPIEIRVCNVELSFKFVGAGHALQALAPGLPRTTTAAAVPATPTALPDWIQSRINRILANISVRFENLAIFATCGQAAVSVHSRCIEVASVDPRNSWRPFFAEPEGPAQVIFKEISIRELGVDCDSIRPGTAVEASAYKAHDSAVSFATASPDETAGALAHSSGVVFRENPVVLRTNLSVRVRVPLAPTCVVDAVDAFGLVHTEPFSPPLDSLHREEGMGMDPFFDSHGLQDAADVSVLVPVDDRPSVTSRELESAFLVHVFVDWVDMYLSSRQLLLLQAAFLLLSTSPKGVGPVRVMSSISSSSPRSSESPPIPIHVSASLDESPMEVQSTGWMSWLWKGDGGDYDGASPSTDSTESPSRAAPVEATAAKDASGIRSQIFIFNAALSGVSLTFCELIDSRARYRARASSSRMSASGSTAAADNSTGAFSNLATPMGPQKKPREIRSGGTSVLRVPVASIGIVEIDASVSSDEDDGDDPQRYSADLIGSATALWPDSRFVDSFNVQKDGSQPRMYLLPSRDSVSDDGNSHAQQLKRKRSKGIGLRRLESLPFFRVSVGTVFAHARAINPGRRDLTTSGIANPAMAVPQIFDMYCDLHSFSAESWNPAKDEERTEKTDASRRILWKLMHKNVSDSVPTGNASKVESMPALDVDGEISPSSSYEPSVSILPIIWRTETVSQPSKSLEHGRTSSCAHPYRLCSFFTAADAFLERQRQDRFPLIPAPPGSCFSDFEWSSMAKPVLRAHFVSIAGTTEKQSWSMLDTNCAIGTVCAVISPELLNRLCQWVPSPPSSILPLALSDTASSIVPSIAPVLHELRGWRFRLSSNGTMLSFVGACDTEMPLNITAAAVLTYRDVAVLAQQCSYLQSALSFRHFTVDCFPSRIVHAYRKVLFPVEIADSECFQLDVHLREVVCQLFSHPLPSEPVIDSLHTVLLEKHSLLRLCLSNSSISLRGVCGPKDMASGTVTQLFPSLTFPVPSKNFLESLDFDMGVVAKIEEGQIDTRTNFAFTQAVISSLEWRALEKQFAIKPLPASAAAIGSILTVNICGVHTSAVCAASIAACQSAVDVQVATPRVRVGLRSQQLAALETHEDILVWPADLSDTSEASTPLVILRATGVPHNTVASTLDFAFPISSCIYQENVVGKSSQKGEYLGTPQVHLCLSISNGRFCFPTFLKALSVTSPSFESKEPVGCSISASSFVAPTDRSIISLWAARAVSVPWNNLSSGGPNQFMSLSMLQLKLRPWRCDLVSSSLVAYLPSVDVTVFQPAQSQSVPDDSRCLIRVEGFCAGFRLLRCLASSDLAVEDSSVLHASLGLSLTSDITLCKQRTDAAQTTLNLISSIEVAPGGITWDHQAHSLILQMLDSLMASLRSFSLSWPPSDSGRDENKDLPISVKPTFLIISSATFHVTAAQLSLVLCRDGNGRVHSGDIFTIAARRFTAVISQASSTCHPHLPQFDVSAALASLDVSLGEQTESLLLETTRPSPGPQLLLSTHSPTTCLSKRWPQSWLQVEADSADSGKLMNVASMLGAIRLHLHARQLHLIASIIFGFVRQQRFGIGNSEDQDLRSVSVLLKTFPLVSVPSSSIMLTQFVVPRSVFWRISAEEVSVDIEHSAEIGILGISAGLNGCAVSGCSSESGQDAAQVPSSSRELTINVLATRARGYLLKASASVPRLEWLHVDASALHVKTASLICRTGSSTAAADCSIVCTVAPVRARIALSGCMRHGLAFVAALDFSQYIVAAACLPPGQPMLDADTAFFKPRTHSLLPVEALRLCYKLVFALEGAEISTSADSWTITDESSASSNFSKLIAASASIGKFGFDSAANILAKSVPIEAMSIVCCDLESIEGSVNLQHMSFTVSAFESTCSVADLQGSGITVAESDKSNENAVSITFSSDPASLEFCSVHVNALLPILRVHLNSMSWGALTLLMRSCDFFSRPTSTSSGVKHVATCLPPIFGAEEFFYSAQKHNGVPVVFCTIRDVLVHYRVSGGRLMLSCAAAFPEENLSIASAAHFGPACITGCVVHLESLSLAQDVACTATVLDSHIYTRTSQIWPLHPKLGRVWVSMHATISSALLAVTRISMESGSSNGFLTNSWWRCIESDGNSSTHNACILRIGAPVAATNCRPGALPAFAASFNSAVYMQPYLRGAALGERLNGTMWMLVPHSRLLLEAGLPIVLTVDQFHIRYTALLLQHFQASVQDPSAATGASIIRSTESFVSVLPRKSLLETPLLKTEEGASWVYDSAPIALSTFKRRLAAQLPPLPHSGMDFAIPAPSCVKIDPAVSADHAVQPGTVHVGDFAQFIRHASWFDSACLLSKSVRVSTDGMSKVGAGIFSPECEAILYKQHGLELPESAQFVSRTHLDYATWTSSGTAVSMDPSTAALYGAGSGAWWTSIVWRTAIPSLLNDLAASSPLLLAPHTFLRCARDARTGTTSIVPHSGVPSTLHCVIDAWSGDSSPSEIRSADYSRIVGESTRVLSPQSSARMYADTRGWSSVVSFCLATQSAAALAAMSNTSSGPEFAAISQVTWFGPGPDGRAHVSSTWRLRWSEPFLTASCPNGVFDSVGPTVQGSCRELFPQVSHSRYSAVSTALLGCIQLRYSWAQEFLGIDAKDRVLSATIPFTVYTVIVPTVKMVVRTSSRDPNNITALSIDSNAIAGSVGGDLTKVELQNLCFCASSVNLRARRAQRANFPLKDLLSRGIGWQSHHYSFVSNVRSLELTVENVSCNRSYSIGSLSDVRACVATDRIAAPDSVLTFEWPHNPAKTEVSVVVGNADFQLCPASTVAAAHCQRVIESIVASVKSSIASPTSASFSSGMEPLFCAGHCLVVNLTGHSVFLRQAGSQEKAWLLAAGDMRPYQWSDCEAPVDCHGTLALALQAAIADSEGNDHTGAGSTLNDIDLDSHDDTLVIPGRSSIDVSYVTDGYWSEPIVVKKMIPETASADEVDVQRLVATSCSLLLDAAAQHGVRKRAMAPLFWFVSEGSLPSEEELPSLREIIPPCVVSVCTSTPPPHLVILIGSHTFVNRSLQPTLSTMNVSMSYTLPFPEGAIWSSEASAVSLVPSDSAPDVPRAVHSAGGLWSAVSSWWAGPESSSGSRNDLGVVSPVATGVLANAVIYDDFIGRCISSVATSPFSGSIAWASLLPAALNMQLNNIERQPSCSLSLCPASLSSDVDGVCVNLRDVVLNKSGETSTLQVISRVSPSPAIYPQTTVLVALHFPTDDSTRLWCMLRIAMTQVTSILERKSFTMINLTLLDPLIANSLVSPAIPWALHCPSSSRRFDSAEHLPVPTLSAGGAEDWSRSQLVIGTLLPDQLAAEVVVAKELLRVLHASSKLTGEESSGDAAVSLVQNATKPVDCIWIHAGSDVSALQRQSRLLLTWVAGHASVVPMSLCILSLFRPLVSVNAAVELFVDSPFRLHNQLHVGIRCAFLDEAGRILHLFECASKRTESAMLPVGALELFTPPDESVASINPTGLSVRVMLAVDGGQWGPLTRLSLQSQAASDGAGGETLLPGTVLLPTRNEGDGHDVLPPLAASPPLGDSPDFDASWLWPVVCGSSLESDGPSRWFTISLHHALVVDSQVFTQRMTLMPQAAWPSSPHAHSRQHCVVDAQLVAIPLQLDAAAVAWCATANASPELNPWVLFALTILHPSSRLTSGAFSLRVQLPHLFPEVCEWLHGRLRLIEGTNVNGALHARINRLALASELPALRQLRRARLLLQIDGEIVDTLLLQLQEASPCCWYLTCKVDTTAPVLLVNHCPHSVSVSLECGLSMRSVYKHRVREAISVPSGALQRAFVRLVEIACRRNYSGATDAPIVLSGLESWCIDTKLRLEHEALSVSVGDESFPCLQAQSQGEELPAAFPATVNSSGTTGPRYPFHPLQMCTELRGASFAVTVPPHASIPFDWLFLTDACVLEIASAPPNGDSDYFRATLLPAYPSYWPALEAPAFEAAHSISSGLVRDTCALTAPLWLEPTKALDDIEHVSASFHCRPVLAVRDQERLVTRQRLECGRVRVHVLPAADTLTMPPVAPPAPSVTVVLRRVRARLWGHDVARPFSRRTPAAVHVMLPTGEVVPWWRALPSSAALAKGSGDCPPDLERHHLVMVSQSAGGARLLREHLMGTQAALSTPLLAAALATDVFIKSQHLALNDCVPLMQHRMVGTLRSLSLSVRPSAAGMQAAGGGLSPVIAWEATPSASHPSTCALTVLAVAAAHARTNNIAAPAAITAAGLELASLLVAMHGPLQLAVTDTTFVRLIDAYRPVLRRLAVTDSRAQVVPRGSSAATTRPSAAAFPSFLVAIDDLSLKNVGLDVSLALTAPLHVSLQQSRLRYSNLRATHVYTAPGRLAREALAVAITDTLLQVPSVLGSLDILGNPAGLVRSAVQRAAAAWGDGSSSSGGGGGVGALGVPARLARSLLAGLGGLAAGLMGSVSSLALVAARNLEGSSSAAGGAAAAAAAAGKGGAGKGGAGGEGTGRAAAVAASAPTMSEEAAVEAGSEEDEEAAPIAEWWRVEEAAAVARAADAARVPQPAWGSLAPSMLLVQDDDSGASPPLSAALRGGDGGSAAAEFGSALASLGRGLVNATAALAAAASSGGTAPSGFTSGPGRSSALLRAAAAPVVGGLDFIGHASRGLSLLASSAHGSGPLGTTSDDATACSGGLVRTPFDAFLSRVHAPTRLAPRCVAMPAVLLRARTGAPAAAMPCWLLRAQGEATTLVSSDGGCLLLRAAAATVAPAAEGAASPLPPPTPASVSVSPLTAQLLRYGGGGLAQLLQQIPALSDVTLMSLRVADASDASGWLVDESSAGAATASALAVASAGPQTGPRFLPEPTAAVTSGGSLNWLLLMDSADLEFV